MKMIEIDLNRIRETLPERAIVTVAKTKNGAPYIEFEVRNPGLYKTGSKDEEKDLEMVFDWQRKIIGSENISEFYTEETGSHWYIYLKRMPINFINVADGINSYVLV